MLKPVYFYSFLLLLTSTGISAQEVGFREDGFSVFTSFEMVRIPPPKKPDYTTVPIERYNPAPVMFLKVSITIKQVYPGEYIVLVLDNTGTMRFRKKIKEGLEIPLDFGNFEEVKERKQPYLYNIWILNKKKDKLSKIKLEVLENGALFVNEQPHGNN